MLAIPAWHERRQVTNSGATGSVASFATVTGGGATDLDGNGGGAYLRGSTGLGNAILYFPFCRLLNAKRACHKFRWNFGETGCIHRTAFHDTGYLDLEVRITQASGQVALYRNGALLASVASAVPSDINVWRLMRMEAFIDDTTGYIRVYADGDTDTPLVEFDGDTKASSGTHFAGVSYQGLQTPRWDDDECNIPTLLYDGGTLSAPADGITITGGTSGATAVVSDVDSQSTGVFGRVVLHSISGTFVDGETITGTSFSAAVNAPTADFVGGLEPNSGLPPASFCGWFSPTGAGDTTGLTPSAGANYAAVDEVPSDGGTTYVEDTTGNLHDLYETADLPSSALQVVSVTVCGDALSNEDGIDHWRGMYKISGGSAVSNPTIGGTAYDDDSEALSASVKFVHRTFQTAPDGSGAFTPAIANNAQSGPYFRTTD